ncbi:MAG TPA: hypothetical protein VFO00_10200 [Vitreimonas sp.]|nr:hypothetical protein [Vitreimonas sp.]
MKLRALLLALCVVACGQPTEKAKAPEPGASADPFDLNIEVGRYGVMLNQVAEHTGERPGLEPEVTDPRDLARRLRETVWEYNLERSRLCAKGVLPEATCGPSHEPVWISEPATAAPSLDDIQIRSAAVGAEVMRLWNAVCEDAASRVEDEQERMYVCAIE